VAANQGDAAKVKAILDDYTTAPIDERLRSTLGFLSKLTLTPKDVTPSDIEPMRAAGASDKAIEEAIYVCTLFSIIDRIADAMDFEVAAPELGPRTGWILLKLGYGVASIPG
jgi:alkylhydroperoxidase family enzyme